ncbi:ATP-binding protein [Alphaproteobacteria bacterium]|nr:ATP-binding protein [Alphaproteobacteria bacterium]
MMFKTGNTYKRDQIAQIACPENPPKGGNWSTGYAKLGTDLYVFMNIGVPGRTGHDFDNDYDKENNLITWYGKPNSHSDQPIFQELVAKTIRPLFFARWEQNDPFMFIGTGVVDSYEDGVITSQGHQCIKLIILADVSDQALASDGTDVSSTSDGINFETVDTPTLTTNEMGSTVTQQRQLSCTKGNKVMTNFIQQKDEQLALQRQRVEDQKSTGRQFRFIGGQQFFTSMRDVGYENEGQAIQDIVDNGIEAGASEVHVLIKNDGPRGAIQSIAIVDNGHGMDKEWLEASIGFGSTSRGTKRDGLGRFGMGLSSAGIAFSERLDVYSHSTANGWHRTFIDIEEGSPTCFTDDYLENTLDFRPPQAEPVTPPDWVMEQVGDIVAETGTIVVLSALTPSRRKWTFKDFEKNLAQTMGVTYHKMAADLELYLNNEKIWFIDPLFVTKGMKGFDSDEDRAEFLAEDSVEITDNESGKSYGFATVRFSVLPPSFGLKSEFKKIKGTNAQGNNGNSRFNVMRDYNGVVLVRNGRVIGVDSKKPMRFGNNDYNIGVELMFSGEADDLFGVTTLKNKVSLKKEAWDVLAKVGLTRGIQAARARRNDLFADWRSTVLEPSKDKDGNLVRPFEQAASIENKQPRKPLGKDVASNIQRIGEANLEQEVKKRANKSGQPETIVRNDLNAEIATTDFKAEVRSLRGSEFVTFEPLGMQVRLIINSDHPFYKNLFGAPHTTGFGKEALGTMLTSFFRALTQTYIGQTEGGKALFDSMVATNLMKSWSEIMSHHMDQLSGLADPNLVDFEDNDPPSETQVS